MSNKTNDSAISVIHPFENVLQTMGISKRDIAEVAYDLDLPPLDFSVQMQLEHDGFEIHDILNNSDITFSTPHEYFLFKKRPVLVYIRDQLLSREAYEKNKFSKYHVCLCKSLEKARKENRFESRYIITTNTSGNFLVNISLHRQDGFVEENVYKRLEICQDCLRELNWENFNMYCGTMAEWWLYGYPYKRYEIVKNFDIDKFLKVARQNLFSGIEKISSHVARKERTLSRDDKNTLKYQCGYKCAKCAKVFAKSDLQIHHIDHNEGNNLRSNLMVLCSECHKQLHREEGGYIGDR